MRPEQVGEGRAGSPGTLLGPGRGADAHATSPDPAVPLSNHALCRQGLSGSVRSYTAETGGPVATQNPAVRIGWLLLARPPDATERNIAGGVTSVPTVTPVTTPKRARCPLILMAATR